jgi:hypothetical protein
MSEAGDKAAAKAQEVKEALSKLEWRDRVALFSAVGLIVLFPFPWWRISIEMFGEKRSESVNGMSGAGWLGFLIACCFALVGVVNMGFLPLSAEIKGYARKTLVQLGLAAAMLFVGPIRFLSTSRGDTALHPFLKQEAGNTMFFWLALLAALAATAAIAWKFLDEQRAKATPPA